MAAHSLRHLRCVATLGAKVKRAFLLAQFEGMGYEAIGRELGVTPRTVVTYVVQVMAHCCLHAAPQSAP